MRKLMLDSLKKNSTARPKEPKKFLTVHGNLSNQYEYGAVPYYLANTTFPAGIFRSSGELKVRAGKVPIKADYFYSTPKFISGLNNYFTIKLDVDELAKMRNAENLLKSKSLRARLDSLELINKDLYQKLALSQLLKANQLPIPGLPGLPALPDLTGNNPLNDSLKLNLPGNINYAHYADSLKNLYAIDTSFAKMTALKTKIEDNGQLIKVLKQKINAVEFPKPDASDGSVFPQTKVMTALAGFKKLEVGMCYPNYSTFMINQVAIKGVNTKYEFKNAFVNATYGKTVVNYSVQPAANAVLNQIQNLTSLFDWSKTQDEKKITSAKIGFGKETKSYIGIGGLYGKGTTSPFSTDVKKNYVIELDGRLAYKFVNFESAVAQSYMIDNTVAPVQSEQPGSSQAANGTRSFQGKLYGVAPKIKTKFSVLYKRVEPNFKSFASGFMRSDILRYETKLEQPVGNKIKLGFNFRHDEDNLKNLSSYKTRLNNYNYSAKVKLFKRRVDVTLNYVEIYQNTANILSNENTKIKSTIKTGIITYSPKLKKFISTNTFIANLYQLQNYNENSTLQNYSLNSFNQIKKWRINALNAYNMSTLKDSLNFSNAINNTLEIGYQFSDNFSVTAGGKHAYSINAKTSYIGYSATINLKLHKLLNIEFRAEKLVIGDFINTLNYTGIRQFPYYGYVKVISTF